MRRNAATLLRYVIFAALFVLVGPLLLKLLLAGSKASDRYVRSQVGGALPQDPEVHERAQHNVGDILNFEPQKPAVDTRQAVGQQPEQHQPVFNNNNHVALQGTHPLFNFDNVDLTLVKDWHDYTHMMQEQERTGPGEQGAAVILSADEEKKKDTLYKVNGFNALASDKISLDRALKDIRHPDCKHQEYLQQLPNVSIVVPFHNEHWTTLLRTVHSVLNHSPLHLIHEIILVDDFSNKENLGQTLTDHIESNYNGKVRLLRANQREGLIRTRLIGAKAATGQVLIFLDSHVEATANWLPPLLEPIAQDYKTAVCPFIDVIDYETFAYRAQDEGARGAFDWEFFYKRLPLLPEDLKHPAKPFKSPVMAGGLFAISTKWFWEMGGYDPGLDIWGGEQYELSFKLWMCGGTMVDAPCSRVAHVYRKFNPFGGVGKGDYTGKIWQCGGRMYDAPCSRVGHIYRGSVPQNKPPVGIGDFVGRNYRRVAEVWMDEYAEHIYRRRPHYRNIDPGDVSEQKAIREKLKCKSFKWFIEEIAFDLPKKYPPVEPPTQASGELRNVGNNMCVDTRFKGQNDRFGLETCIKDSAAGGGEQSFELTWHKDLRPKKRTVCFDVSQSTARAPVLLYGCHGMLGNQHFKYNPNTHQLYHPISGQCLDCDSDAKELFMNPCNSDLPQQKWQFESMNITAVQIEWDLR